MTCLDIPEHVRQSAVQGRPVSYVWKGTADFNHESPKVGKALQGLSARACLACASGMAEWIVWRLHGLSDFPFPLQMIEASWAANVDVRYCDIPTESEFEERKGPIDGVLLATKDLVESALRSYDTPTAKNVPVKTIPLYFLARHVMPDKAPFDAWLKEVLRRLRADYPRVADDPKGAPVPREAVATAAAFEARDAARMINDFLVRLKPVAGENRYMRSPEDMRAAGFVGTPFQYP